MKMLTYKMYVWYSTEESSLQASIKIFSQGGLQDANNTKMWNILRLLNTNFKESILKMFISRENFDTKICVRIMLQLLASLPIGANKQFEIWPCLLWSNISQNVMKS